MGDVVIDRQKIWHLGDQTMSNYPPLHGIEKEWAFKLEDAHEDAKLHMDVLGTAATHNEVYVNGKWVGHLRKNNDENEYEKTVLPVAASKLEAGQNKLLVKSGWLDEDDHSRGRDDFLIHNIHLHI